MSAVVTAVMPTMVSKTTMAAVVPKAEADKRKAVTVTINAAVAVMPTVMSMTASNLFDDASVLDHGIKSGRRERRRI